MTLADGVVLAQDSRDIIKPVWTEVLVALLLFGLLCFVLMKFVFPRMEATFKARADAIEGGLARAERTTIEAKAVLEQFRAEIAAARAEAAVIRERARAEAYEIRAEVMAGAEAAREQVLAEGRAALAADRVAVLAELHGVIGEIAVDLAGRIVGESLMEDARARGTVEEFLRERETARD
ncbi:ATP synthase subunit b [Actinorhabdospora filicis]|uniref:ATP synthase subunit b n=1 Tax=Actinorhabdospora filicis TaxID=1785913 RepID=A0A9W6SGC1_9ACTN|nr:F0F1 ATP synthase subunit B [Actinorhabdospora filicis]GLZ75493.1 ATP synthase subunit b [Actinorhabdospora filicis]